MGSLIYVDQRGQVRSASRYKQRVVWGTAGAVAAMAAYTGILSIVGGPIGFAVGAAFSLLVVRNLAASRALHRATVLLAASRLAEAERLLVRLLARRSTPYRIKATAEQARARIAALCERHDQALALQSSAIYRLSNDRRARARRRMLEYDRMVTLVNLGQVPEARRRFEALPRTLEGDYLRLQRTITELYLALAEETHQFDPSFLREQADIALGLREVSVLPALLAWAQDFAGHSTEAASLLTAARQRPSLKFVHKLYPRLGAWMDAQLR
jgi:tetratricopeptide (TPR) repeat protein